MNKALITVSFIGIFIILVVLINAMFFAHEENKVYITRTGNCYHSCACQYTIKSCKAIGEQVALKYGYTRCSVCKGRSQEKIIVNEYGLSVAIVGLIAFACGISYLIYADNKRKINKNNESNIEELY